MSHDPRLFTLRTSCFLACILSVTILLLENCKYQYKHLRIKQKLWGDLKVLTVSFHWVWTVEWLCYPKANLQKHLSVYWFKINIWFAFSLFWQWCNLLTPLQEHGVELRHLSAEPLETECTKVVYLVRSQLDLMKHISLHIHDNTSKGLQKECFLYFAPRRSVSCEQVIVLSKPGVSVICWILCFFPFPFIIYFWGGGYKT